MEDPRPATPVSVYTYPTSDADPDSKGKLIFRVEGNTIRFYNVSLKKTRHKDLVFIEDALQTYRSALRVNPEFKSKNITFHFQPFNRELWLSLIQGRGNANLNFFIASSSTNAKEEKIGKRLGNKYKNQILRSLESDFPYLTDIEPNAIYSSDVPADTPRKDLDIKDHNFSDENFIRIPSLAAFSLQELSDVSTFTRMHGVYKENNQKRRENAYQETQRKIKRKLNFVDAPENGPGKGKEEAPAEQLPLAQKPSYEISGRFVIALRHVLKNKLTMGIRLQRFFNIALTQNAKRYKMLKEKYETLQASWYSERLMPVTKDSPKKKPRRLTLTALKEGENPLVVASTETRQRLPKIQRARYLSFWKKAHSKNSFVYKKIKEDLGKLEDQQEKEAKFEEFERLTHNLSLRAAQAA